MATQTDINNAVNQVVNTYTNQTIGYPGVSVGQCPAPVCYYLQALGCPIPAMYGDRADGWGTHFPPELAPYFTHQNYQAGVAYPKGTVLMWDSPHIAIVLSSDGSNTAEVFEQNADPDGSPCHSASRTINESGYHTCTYALVPVLTTNPLPYTIETNFVPKQVEVKVATQEWNVSLATFDEINANPLASVDAGTVFTANGLIHHNDNYDYYLPDVNVAAGYNVLDCEDYSPPPPVVSPAPTLQNYVPTPVKPAQTYTLVTSVPTYPTPGNAATGVGSTGNFPAGIYFVYGTQNGLYQLGINNTSQIASCPWVNSKDNVLPPEPEPLPSTPVITNAGEADETWKSTYKPFNPSNTPITIPVEYTVAVTYNVVDLDNKQLNRQITEGKKIDIYGTFVKDGITYYRPRLKDDTNFETWYGVPIFDTYLGQAILTKVSPVPQKEPSLLQKIRNVRQEIEDDEPKWMDILPKWLRKK
jgi:hypothetical protein